MDATLAAALKRAATDVEAALNDLLPAADGAEARVIQAMRYSALGGGKRLRAFLVMEGAGMFGVDRRCAARVGAAEEMLHAN